MSEAIEQMKELKNKPTTRKVRFMIVNPQDFLMLFTKGMVFNKRAKLIDGVPDDALLVGLTVDHVRGGVVLVLQSETYEEIPMTEMPPIQEVGIMLGVKNATKKKK